MVTIFIIVGSTRPQRKAETVAQWVYEIAQKRTDARFELIDIADLSLPFLDEPIPPSQHKYSQEHTKQWAAKVAQADGYVFVTPEYNHSVPAALKNAIDFVYAEWNNKAAGFVSYGSNGGSRAVEHLRQVMAEIQIADVRAQVLLSLAHDFENMATFKPHERHEQSVNTMLDQLIAWAEALKIVRDKQSSLVK